MAGRPPKPKAKALAEGRDVMNAGRYKERVEIDEGMPALGEPPEWVRDEESTHARTAWELFRAEAPWLKASHRTIVALASQVYGQMIAGEGMSVAEMTLLRGLLSSLGMTPSDASKVVSPEAAKKPKGSIVSPRQKR